MESLAAAVESVRLAEMVGLAAARNEDSCYTRGIRIDEV